ncbi:MAG: barstar family protein [Micropruina sp.]|uniref:barstar family protein n=1 Tax=Micropruina sp. TaxID=2737536 RepID=UPI0039E4C5C3
MTSREPAAWTCLAEVLGIEGNGLLFADARDGEELIGRCRDAGYTVVAVDTAGVTDFREAQRRIADGLRLPETAGRNLDALADSLADLARYWPGAPRLVLAWCRPERVIEADPTGWFRLTDVLTEATERLWRGGTDPADRLFETLLLAEGYDG